MMRDLTTTPPHWPKPVPLLMWTADYADIRERVQRDGRLDRDEVWLPASDDSFNAFMARHRSQVLRLGWRELNQLERERKAEAAERHAARVAKEQERWEALQLKRQQAKQAEADREWAEQEAKIEAARRAQQLAMQAKAQQERERAAEQARRQAQTHREQLQAKRAEQERIERSWVERIELSKAHWAEINPSYATQEFRIVEVAVGFVYAGMTFKVGTYCLPGSIAKALESAPGFAKVAKEAA